MKRILVSLIVITCFFSTVAPSQKKGARKSPCVDTQTQAEANACARHQYEKADAEMNRVYGQLMSELAGRWQGSAEVEAGATAVASVPRLEL
jgi:uncharacterized protein YecT (DUF1311 family)